MSSPLVFPVGSAGVTPAEALERLREGNHRFASDVRSLEALQSGSRRAQLAAVQKPFAIVLGCSDARAPAEMIFDQGLGELFVIRVAGNIVAPSQIGSVEFAAERFGTRLVVVLGHTRCGAVEAAVEAIQSPSIARSRNLSSIVDRVRPAVEEVVRFAGNRPVAEIIHEAVRANVRACASHLRQGSPIIENLVLNEGLWIVGAEYDLDTGLVDFFDGVPPT